MALHTLSLTGFLSGSKSVDTFHDTDDTLLTAHKPEIGPSWQGGDANYRIQDNVLSRTSGAVNYAYIDTGLSNVSVKATFDTINGPGSAIFARFIDENNYWIFYYTGGGTWQLMKVVSGTPELVGEAFNGHNGDVELFLHGSTIIATGPFGFTNIVNDAAILSGTKCGILLLGDGSASTASNWSVDSLNMLSIKDKKAVNDTLTGSALFAKRPNKFVVATVNLSGSTSKQTQKTLTDNLSGAISLSKQAKRILTDTLAEAGSLTKTKISNKLLSTTLTLNGAFTKAYIAGVPPVYTKRPTIVLTYPYVSPSLTLTLRSPELEDSEKDVYNRIIRESRGGDQKIYRDNKWPQSRLLNYEIIFNKNQVVLDFLNFVSVSIGKEIGLLDYLSRQWRGILIPPETIFTHRGRSDRSVNFEFEGELV